MTIEESGALDDLVRRAVSLDLIDGVEPSDDRVLVRLGRLSLPFTEQEAVNYLRGLLRVHAREADLPRGAVGV